MVEFVGKNSTAAFGQGGDNRQISQVAGGEGDGAGKTDQGGEFPLQGFVRQEMAADQVGGAGSGAPAPGTFDHGRDNIRMIGQAEVVVAGEGQQLPPLDNRPAAAGRSEDAAAAGQAGGG